MRDKVAQEVNERAERECPGPGAGQRPDRGTGRDVKGHDHRSPAILPAVPSEREPQELGLVVGRIVAVEDHAGARAPSYRLTVDLGGEGRREADLPAAQLSRADLLGRQVVCTTEGDNVLLLRAHSRSRGAVLVSPDDEVEEGSPVA